MMGSFGEYEPARDETAVTARGGASSSTKHARVGGGKPSFADGVDEGDDCAEDEASIERVSPLRVQAAFDVSASASAMMATLGHR